MKELFFITLIVGFILYGMKILVIDFTLLKKRWHQFSGWLKKTYLKIATGFKKFTGFFYKLFEKK